MTAQITAGLAGLGFGLSLIVAIGAQNAFVLRQGLRREHVFAVVAICALSDALLIAVGIAGLGAIIQRVEWLLLIIEFVGGIFLLTYGTRAALRAIKPHALSPEIAGTTTSLAKTVSTTLALTFLNPHVYLDTVLLLGSVAGTYGSNDWWFGAGAIAGSIIWFSTLGFGARLLTPAFKSIQSWRVLDSFIAIIMFALGATLLWSFIQRLL